MRSSDVESENQKPSSGPARAFGGAGSAPVAREPLGTSTHPGGEAIARACAGAWGRDPGRVAAHASATPTRGRVPLNASHGKILRASRPGGTHQAVACVTFSALRRLDGGARGEVLPPTHRGVSGDERERGVRAARGRLNGAEDPNSFLAFRLNRRRVRLPARLVR